MNAKLRLVGGLSILIALVAIGFLSIGYAFEPLDPFPRSEKTVKCLDGSSVVFTKRKVGWFTEETELSVRLFDKRGKLIRAQSTDTFPHWNDSEMKILETPEWLCNQENWHGL